MVHDTQTQAQMELYYEHPTDDEMCDMHKKLCDLKYTFSSEKFFNKDYDKNLFSKKTRSKKDKFNKIGYFYRALIPEIYFLKQILSSDSTMLLKEKIIVVYITDSGSTVVVLSKLYPDIDFHIYPSGGVKNNCIDRRLATIDNVTVFDSPIQWDDSKKYIEREKNIITLLICNTACGKKEKGCILKKQKEWYNITNPEYALLKFQLNSYNGKTKYFDGVILLPVFSNANCTQIRLIISSGEFKIWDHDFHDKFIYTMNLHRLCEGTNINTNILKSVLNDYCEETKFTYDDAMRIIGMTLTQKQQLASQQMVKRPQWRNSKRSLQQLGLQQQCWRSR